jgi:glycerol-3-phosphate acyltransferase PlsX
MGPSEVAAGARLAAEQGVHVLLFGPLAELGDAGSGVEVIDAPVSVAKSPDPVRAVRSTPEASIVQAAKAVGEGRADALVCAGGTGAALAASLFNVKRAPGIHRPALALPIPVPGSAVTLLDVGAGVQARPEHLVQFAFMGAAFASAVLGVERPRVGLLSNGEESERGSESVVQAGKELAQRSSDGQLRFVGNVEGGDIVDAVADVIVTDGFTGNVTLKAMEGTTKLYTEFLRASFKHSLTARIGYFLARRSLRKLQQRLDPRRYNGAVFLGLQGIAVKSHGSADALAFANAIGVAVDMKVNGFLEQIRDGVARLHALQAPVEKPQSAAL